MMRIRMSVGGDAVHHAGEGEGDDERSRFAPETYKAWRLRRDVAEIETRLTFAEREALRPRKELLELDLSYTEIETLPESIGELENLQVLRCYWATDLVHIDPKGLAKLTKLRELDLSGTSILYLPEAIGELENLETLNCFWAKALWSQGFRESGAVDDEEDEGFHGVVTEVREEEDAPAAGTGWTKLTKLRNLDLSGTDFVSLPEAIGDLEDLRVLRCCWATSLRHVNRKALKKLKKLRELDLSGTGIQTLPEEIGDLENLRILKCSSAKRLDSVAGSGLARLKDLLELDLSGTKIRVLPEAVGELEKLRLLRCQLAAESSPVSSRQNVTLERLKNLRTLDLSHSSIRSVPPAIATLEHLEALTFYGTASLSDVDSRGGLKNLRNLRELDLSQTGIRALPEAIGDLESLVTLKCCGATFLGSVDSEGLKKLKKLRELDLSRTGIRSLPDAIGYLENLESLKCCAATRLTEVSVDGESGLKCLKKLRELDLSRTGIAALPEAIGGLENLEALKCCGATRLASVDGEGLKKLEKLREVDLSRTGIEVLPDGIGSLESLETLKCCGAEKLASVGSGEGLRHLKKLQELDLSRTGIQTLPGAIGDLESLEVLNCSGAARLVSLEGRGWGTGLKNLRRLDLSRTALRRLPSDVGDLVNLEVLNCSGAARLEKVDGEGWRKLQKLQEVDLSRTGMQNVPAAIGDLKNLESLNCSGLTGMVSMDDQSFETLKSLRQLDLSRTGIPTLPSAIGCFDELEVLKCIEATDLASLDAQVLRKLRKLRRLDLSRTSIQALPDAIGELQNLEILRCDVVEPLASVSWEGLRRLKNLRKLLLSHTLIDALPAEIGDLENLEVLDCSESALSTLPPEIGRLKKLRELYLDGCSELTELPSDVVDMHSLADLDLFDCQQLETPPEDYLGDWRLSAQESADRVKDYFREIERAAASRDFQVSSRVVFLGHSLAGKSQLVDMLMETRFHPIPLDARTDCAVVHHTTTTRDGGEGCRREPSPYAAEHLVSEKNEFLQKLHSRRTSVWDLAGQREFAFLHNRFLTNRAAYVVVVTAEREQQHPRRSNEKVAIDLKVRARQVECWVRKIRHISQDAPVLVVLNKFPRHSSVEDREEMVRQLFEELKQSGCGADVELILVADHYGDKAIETLTSEQQEQIDSISAWIRAKLDSFRRPRMPKVTEIAEKVTQKMAETGRPFVPFEQWLEKCDAAMESELPGGRKLGPMELQGQLRILNQSGMVMWDDRPAAAAAVAAVAVNGGEGERRGRRVENAKKSVLLNPLWVIEKFCLLYDTGKQASATLQKWVESQQENQANAMLHNFRKRGVITLWKSDLEEPAEEGKCWSPGMQLFQELLLADRQFDGKELFLHELLELAVELRMAYRRDIRERRYPTDETEVDALEYVFPGRLCEIDNDMALQMGWEETWDDRQLIDERDRVYGWHLEFQTVPIDFMVPAMCSLYNRNKMGLRSLWVTELMQPQDHLERVLLRAEDRRDGEDYMVRVDVRYENTSGEMPRCKRPHQVEVVVRLTFDLGGGVAHGKGRTTAGASTEAAELRMWDVFTRVMEHVLEEIEGYASKNMKENMGIIMFRYADSRKHHGAWTQFELNQWSSEHADNDLWDVNGLDEQVPLGKLRPPWSLCYGERLHKVTHSGKHEYVASDPMRKRELIEKQKTNRILREEIAQAVISLANSASNQEAKELLSKSTCPYMFELEDFPEDGRGRLSKRFFDKKRMYLIDQRTMQRVEGHEGYPLASFHADRLQSRLVHGLGTFNRRYNKWVQIDAQARIFANADWTVHTALAGAEVTKNGLGILVECLDGLELNAKLKEGATKTIAEGGYATVPGRWFRIDLVLDPSLLEAVEKKLREYDKRSGKPGFESLMHKELFPLENGSKVVVWVANSADDAAASQQIAVEQGTEIAQKASAAQQQAPAAQQPSVGTPKKNSLLTKTWNRVKKLAKG